MEFTYTAYRALLDLLRQAATLLPTTMTIKRTPAA